MSQLLLHLGKPISFVLLLSLFLIPVCVASSPWPTPKLFREFGTGREIFFDTTSLAKTNDLSSILGRAVDRFLSRIGGYDGVRDESTLAIRVINFEIEENDESSFPSLDTNYSYAIFAKDDSESLIVSSASVYGAMYALETLSQMVRLDTNRIPYDRFEVRDAPDYAWRGLMIDSGRRFVPKDTLLQLIDVMAAVKLNVLHLHASDMCRFGVESLIYPNLTNSLQGINGGFYTQKDVGEIVTYAKDRGVRVVPEFDIPGHSRGFIPIEGSSGLSFCEPDSPSRSQLHGTNETFDVLRKILGEMSRLFPDKVFNIGSDETAAKGDCTVASTFDIERRVLETVETELEKVAMGWEEVLFDAGAATNETIVDAWSRHRCAEIVATGHRCVESKSSSFYFTQAAPGGAEGWKDCWYDISTDVSGDSRELLLGGEMSMWTDTYCYIDQCGASTGATPVGSALFGPETDAAFAKSIGGMIWPRGYVGASAFWNYNASVDPSSDAFARDIWALNDRLTKRGALVCPTNCSCDQLSACGKPY